MPKMRRHESGALVFDKTPEELKIDELSQKVKALEDKTDKLEQNSTNAKAKGGDK
jgi:outer membrane murein-binding lipoprotein Lpp